MRAIPARVPVDMYHEINNIAKEMNISFSAAAKVWEQKKFNLPKWKTL